MAKIQTTNPAGTCVACKIDDLTYEETRIVNGWGYCKECFGYFKDNAEEHCHNIHEQIQK